MDGCNSTPGLGEMKMHELPFFSYMIIRPLVYDAISYLWFSSMVVSEEKLSMWEDFAQETTAPAIKFHLYGAV